MGTVGTGEAAGTGAATTARGGRGRRTRGGVLARRADRRGAPPGPEPESTAGGAVTVAVAVRRRARVEMRPEGLQALGAGCQRRRVGRDRISDRGGIGSL